MHIFWKIHIVLLFSVFALVVVACGGGAAEEEVVEEAAPETTAAPATTAAAAEPAAPAPIIRTSLEITLLGSPACTNR